VSLHEDIPNEVNKVFANHLSEIGEGNSNPPKPLGPLGYFGLPMVNPSKPLLPPNKPYHWPFTYFG
jgi:hypothetical protein